MRSRPDPRLIALLLLLPILAMGSAWGADREPSGADKSQPWEKVRELELPAGRSLAITRKQVPHRNPKRVNHEYRFTVVGDGDSRRDAPWRPVVTDLTELGPARAFKIMAAWMDDDDFLVLVFRDMWDVNVRVVDMRPGDGRPDFAGQEQTLLVRFGDVDGPNVKSAAFAGSVTDGSLTVRLFGTRVARGQPVEGELAQAVLKTERGSYRWNVHVAGSEKQTGSGASPAPTHPNP